MAKYEREAPALGAQAARTALERAGRAAGEVTHLVTVSCTGFSAPNFDLGLVRELGLPWTVARTHVGFMGCHGALNGLRVAGGYADSDPGACVLVCAVELCSLHYQYGWNSDLAVSNGIFAHGAAALVGGPAPGPSGDDWVLARSGSSLLEDSAELMAWRIGDHGFEIALSARVPSVIEHALKPWLDGWLAAQQLTRSQIATWAVHPGGPRILEAVAAAIGMGRDDYAISQEVLGEFGNMVGGPFGNRVRFELVDLAAKERDEIKTLGTYGFIKGASMFIVGAAAKGNWAMEDYGYCMEKNILAATHLGLGTAAGWEAHSTGAHRLQKSTRGRMKSSPPSPPSGIRRKESR